MYIIRQWTWILAKPESGLYNFAESFPNEAIHYIICIYICVYKKNFPKRNIDAMTKVKLSIVNHKKSTHTDYVATFFSELRIAGRYFGSSNNLIFSVIQADKLHAGESDQSFFHLLTHMWWCQHKGNWL